MNIYRRIKFKLIIDLITHSRIACGIEVPESDNFVITGGWNGKWRPMGGVSRVVRYNTQGEATLLPSLQQQRFHHGCGYYYNNDQVVSCKLYIQFRLLYFFHAPRHTW